MEVLSSLLIWLILLLRMELKDSVPGILASRGVEFPGSGKYCWNVCFWIPSSKDFRRSVRIVFDFCLSFNLVSISTILV